MNEPLDPNTIRFDYANSPEFKGAMANCNEGDEVEVKVVFTVLRQDEGSMVGTIKEVCRYEESSEETKYEPSGAQPIAITIVVNSAQGDKSEGGEPAAPKEEKMAYVAP